MDLKSTLKALRSGWYLLAVGLLISLAVAFTLHRSAEPVYEATASYVVSPGAGAAPSNVTEGVKTLDSSRSRSIMTTLTEISASTTVLAEAVAGLGIDDGATDDYRVSSVVVPEANVIETTVAGPDAATASALATVVGDIAGLRFIALYQIYDVVVLDPATTPTEPSNPGLTELVAMSAALGLLVGGAAALLRDAARRSRARTVHKRLSAYDSTVATIEDHDRFQRAG